jgi:hypothetical protein
MDANHDARGDEMIPRVFCLLIFLGLSACASAKRDAPAFNPWYPATTDNGDTLLAVFEGRIPCVEPELAGCDKIKVALALYRHGTSETPTSYKLARVYVAANPEGARMTVGGAVSVSRGTKLDPSATVYRLDENAPLEFQAYWVIGQDILFILDKDLNPRVGTASWSYVLNRIY